MKFPFIYSSLIGLDVQRDEMRLVQVKKYKKKIELERLASLALPETIFREDDRIADWGEFKTLLKQFLQSNEKSKRISTMIQLPSSLVKMKRLSLPFGMTKKELMHEITMNLELAKENYCIDFRIIRQQKAYLDVLSAAVEQDYIDQYAHAVNDAGLSVKMVTMDVYALHHMVHLGLQQHEQGKIKTILYHKNKSTILAVFNEMELVLHFHWQRMELEEILIQLKKTMQACSKTYGYLKTQQIVLLSRNPYLSNLISDIETWWWGSIYDHRLLQGIPGIQSLPDTEQIDYLMAFSLAMGY